ncbi:MAG: hypothetical protein ACKN9T_00870 [Candidatus Methylumidiphilus sp.]
MLVPNPAAKPIQQHSERTGQQVFLQHAQCGTAIVFHFIYYQLTTYIGVEKMVFKILKLTVITSMICVVITTAVAETGISIEPASRSAPSALFLVLFGFFSGLAIAVFYYTAKPKEYHSYYPVGSRPYGDTNTLLNRTLLKNAVLSVIGAVTFIATLLYAQLGQLPNEIIGALLGVLITGVLAAIQLVYQRRATHVAQEQLDLEREKFAAEQEMERNKTKIAEQKALVEAIRAEQAFASIREYEQMFEEAPKRFVAELRRMITEAQKDATNNQSLTAARAFVSARNDLRSGLESISHRLNSDIDLLEHELKRATLDYAKAAELIEVILLKWPAKELEIENATRKVQADLGLIPALKGRRAQ